MATINYININELKNIDNDKDAQTDKVTFYCLLFTIFLFFIFSIYYFINILKHLIHNKKSGCFIHWYDYI